jgi:hypothetical protein
LIPRSLPEIFKKTKTGIITTLVIRIHHKSSTNSKRMIDSTDTGKIGVDILRGYIDKIKVHVPQVVRIRKGKQVVPSFTKDLASE